MLTVEPLFIKLGAAEYPRLDQRGEACLDFTGSAIYSNRQIDTHSNRLKTWVFGNPLDKTAECLRSVGESAYSIESFSSCLGREIAVGAVRVSIGIPTSVQDVDRAIQVVASFA